MDTLQKNKSRQTSHSYKHSNQDEFAIESEFNRIIQGAYMELASDLIKKGLAPCVVSCLRFQDKMHDNSFFDIFFTCNVMSTSQDPPKPIS